MGKDKRNPLVKKLELQQEKNKQRHVDTLIFFQEKVHRKVRNNNDFGNKQCLYEIPLYEIGLPLYDAYWVKERLLKILREDGFKVESVGPTSMVLDWSIDRLKEQSRDLKKERDAKRAEKAEKKKKSKVIKTS
tara:strand:- start:317 stop:715 length:399 start_codon:yes stop_codon:yes gene_type:complete